MLVKNGYYIVGSTFSPFPDIFNQNNFPENFNKYDYYNLKAYNFFMDSQKDNEKPTFSMTSRKKSPKKYKRSKRKISAKKSKMRKRIKKSKRSRRNL